MVKNRTLCKKNYIYDEFYDKHFDKVMRDDNRCWQRGDVRRIFYLKKSVIKTESNIFLVKKQWTEWERMMRGTQL
jgi:hypothetical protein